MKPANGNRILFFLFLFLLLISCSGEKEPPKKIARAYAEITFIEELYRGFPDSIKTHKKLILKKYGLRDSDIVKTMKRMPADREVWNDFFNEADAVLDSLKKASHR